MPEYPFYSSQIILLERSPIVILNQFSLPAGFPWEEWGELSQEFWRNSYVYSGSVELYILCFCFI